VTILTDFDESRCHKWALLLRERRKKTRQALNAIVEENFAHTKSLFSEVFHGISAGKCTDRGMSGSLLYHMTMVTKMAAETRFLLEELKAAAPDVNKQLWRFYGDLREPAELKGDYLAEDPWCFYQPKHPLRKIPDVNERAFLINIFRNFTL
jgi:hypothetical protein